MGGPPVPGTIRLRRQRTWFVGILYKHVCQIKDCIIGALITFLANQPRVPGCRFLLVHYIVVIKASLKYHNLVQ